MDCVQVICIASIHDISMAVAVYLFTITELGKSLLASCLTANSLTDKAETLVLI